MGGLPSGTVTFLLTDIEGSSRLWEEHPDEMEAALARHDQIVVYSVSHHSGRVVKTKGEGDSSFAVFGRASDALGAALEMQRALGAESWPAGVFVRVRTAVHTGEAELREGDYFGEAVNRCARLRAIANGGQTLVSEVTAGITRGHLPAGASLEDRGSHRLRDLAYPERAYELVHPGVPGDQRPLRSVDAFPNNLPIQLTSFVGRAEDLAGVAKALGQGRLVTLTGVGGVGKTRLAVQCAAGLLPDFNEGVWLCELQAAADHEAMIQLVATALSVQSRTGAKLEHQIRQVLAAKEVLVILDNCEHLLDAAGVFAEDVLAHCPSVRILATSREPLDVSGEQVLRVRSLPAPDAGSDLQEAITADAVRLFVERASAVEADFRLDPLCLAAVVEICQRLDGIPLAIELAASQVATLSPGEIAGLLDERFRLLTGGRRTAVERHRTLRATVDWSYSLLTRTEQHVFDRLGVFTASFDGAAAVAVATRDGLDDWAVREAVASLVHKSMINRMAAETAVSRYQLLETLRAYGRARLEERGEADETRRCHARHYALQAEQRVEAMVSGVGINPTIVGTALDIDDIRAAISWALDSPQPDDVELALRIVACFGGAPPAQRLAAGIVASSARLLERTEGSSRQLRARVLNGMASDAALIDGDIERASALARQALMLAGHLTGDDPVPHLPWMWLTMAAVARGDFEDARQTVAQLRGHTNTDHHLAFAEMFAARVEGAAGDPSAARAHAEAALKRARRSEFPVRIAQALDLVARVTLRFDRAAANVAYNEMVDVERDHPYLERGEGQHTLRLLTSAQLNLAEHQPARALPALREAAAHSTKQGLPVAFRAAFVLAAALADLDRADPAAALAGFVTESRYRWYLPWTIWPDDLADFHLRQSRLRAQMGDAPYNTAIGRGAAMLLDDIGAFMVAVIDDMGSENA
jgi:predicted ATPase/class 3 adenylate cyclase